MAKLDIILAPDPALKTKARPVAAVDSRIRRLMDDMLETMYSAPGIGLAAPQVGVFERVIVLDIAGRDESPRPLRLANPEILWRSEETATWQEGCLSFPEQFGEVTRPAKVKVRYLDQEGQAQEIAAEGLLATCLQHEVDHLDGVLFTDYLSPLKRGMILRRMAKLKRQGEVA